MQTESPETIAARRTKELRQAFGMTQAELASRLSTVVTPWGRATPLDPTAVTRLERGERTIRLDEAAAIAAVFNLTIDELLRDALPIEEEIKQVRQLIADADRRVDQAHTEQAALFNRYNALQQKLGGDPLAGQGDV